MYSHTEELLYLHTEQTPAHTLAGSSSFNHHLRLNHQSLESRTRESTAALLVRFPSK